MRINLIENQVELLMKSLENYAPANKEKQQLIYSTYESLMNQLAEYRVQNTIKNSNFEENKKYI